MKKLIRLFRFAGPWAHLIVIATIALFIITGVNLLAPEITRRIIAIMESGELSTSIDRITILALVLLGCFALRGVCQFLNNYLSHVASWNMVNKVGSADENLDLNKSGGSPCIHMKKELRQ